MASNTPRGAAANTNFKNVPTTLALQANGANGLILATQAASPAPIIFAVGTNFTDEVFRCTSGKLLNVGYLTASKLVFTDSNKSLTSTGIGTSAQFIKGDGSLDSTTYQASGNYITALTGDVTAAGPGSVAATIANNAVTFAKFQQIATASFLGRTTAATGNVENLTATQATALLNAFTTTVKGLVPPPATATGKFLRDDATWATATAFREQTFVVYDSTGTGGITEFYYARVAQTVTVYAVGTSVKWASSTTASPDVFGSDTTVSVGTPGTGIMLQAGASLRLRVVATGTDTWAHVQQTA